MKRKKTMNGKSRLNLRLPSDLDRWMKGYASAKNTTVTQIIIDHFTQLRKTTEVGYVSQV